VFDAHDRAFAFFKGTWTRGIDDNLKTAVDTVFAGGERAYNRRFPQMCAHYLVEPVACTPAAGWEKGQVENQVGTARQRRFTPRLRFKSCEERGAWLLDRCVAWAKAQPHPEVRDRTIWEMFEAERASLVPYAGRFDGLHAVPATVSKTCSLWGAGTPQPRMGPVRQQQGLGLGERRGPAGRDPRLCRPHRAAPGWPRRRRAPPRLRPWPDRL